MATIRGVIKEINEEDFYLLVETINGEPIKILIDELDYAPGEAILAKGYLKDGVMNEPELIVKFPTKELLELDEKANTKLWDFYKPLIEEYRNKNLAEIDKALAKLDDEGGEE